MAGGTWGPCCQEGPGLRFSRRTNRNLDLLKAELFIWLENVNWHLVFQRGVSPLAYCNSQWTKELGVCPERVSPCLRDSGAQRRWGQGSLSHSPQAGTRGEQKPRTCPRHGCGDCSVRQPKWCMPSVERCVPDRSGMCRAQGSARAPAAAPGGPPLRFAKLRLLQARRCSRGARRTRGPGEGLLAPGSAPAARPSLPR